MSVGNLPNARRLRLTVLAGYGGRCACCGTEHEPFLTLDHVAENGADHRRVMSQRSIYRDARDRGFPPDYQVLCFNCNSAKYHKGACACGNALTVEAAMRETPMPRPVRGERHHNAKLTADTARELVQQRAAGLSKSALARRFGLSVTGVCRVLDGTVWAHATGVR